MKRSMVFFATIIITILTVSINSHSWIGDSDTNPNTQLYLPTVPPIVFDFYNLTSQGYPPGLIYSTLAQQVGIQPYNYDWNQPYSYNSSQPYNYSWNQPSYGFNQPYNYGWNQPDEPDGYGYQQPYNPSYSSGQYWAPSLNSWMVPGYPGNEYKQIYGNSLYNAYPSPYGPSGMGILYTGFPPPTIGEPCRY